MLLDSASSSIHQGIDGSSTLARLDLTDVKASCHHANAMLAQRQCRAVEMRKGLVGTCQQSSSCRSAACMSVELALPSLESCDAQILSQTGWATVPHISPQ